MSVFVWQVVKCPIHTIILEVNIWHVGDDLKETSLLTLSLKMKSYMSILTEAHFYYRYY